MGQVFRPPPVFKDVPLWELIEYAKISEELIKLAASEEDKGYWTGWHDCIRTLMGDLTSTTTVKLDIEMCRIFENFRMEDRLILIEEQFKKDMGGPR